MDARRAAPTRDMLWVNGLLLLTALIWGFGFVAQRLGMDHIGPFAFNGIRFILGGLCLVPLALTVREAPAPGKRRIGPLKAGLCAGILLFIAAAAQQIGLVYTTAGKAGFITGMYVVFVPCIGMLMGRRYAWPVWAGAALATVGLYLLSVQGPLMLEGGDALELVGAVFWALHVIALSHLAPKSEPVRLAMVQFFLCGLCSLILALILEPLALSAVRAAFWAILYGGVVSVGAGYTLQVVVQRRAKPTHAAILLSTEAPFAALGGWLLLNETLTSRMLAGCVLMFAAMLIIQLAPERE